MRNSPSSPVKFSVQKHIQPNHQGGDGQILAVYDLGGGTFDISILEISGGVSWAAKWPETWEKNGAETWHQGLKLDTPLEESRRDASRDDGMIFCLIKHDLLLVKRSHSRWVDDRWRFWGLDDIFFGVKWRENCEVKENRDRRCRWYF